MANEMTAPGSLRTIGMIGDAHGKSTLAAAIEAARPDPRRFKFMDWPDRPECAKSMITGMARLDGAVLVVSAGDGPQRRAREDLLLARELGIRAIAVFINKMDLAADEDVAALVELEVRELLSAYDLPDQAAPVVKGSARAALDAGGEGPDAACIRDLLDALDAWVPEPKADADGPLLMPIEDVFHIAGRGTVVTGRIERGAVRDGDEVEIVGARAPMRTVATRVEMPPGLLDEGSAGDRVGVLLRGVDKSELERGFVLARPGSITPHARFKAEVYLLRDEEGGRAGPFFSGHRPQFYFHTTDVTGTARLPAGMDSVMPGDSVELDVELASPVPMRATQRFSIREGGRTVGAGVVTRIEVPDVGAVGVDFGGTRSGGVTRSAGGTAPPAARGGATRGVAAPAPGEAEPGPAVRRLHADLTLFDETGETRIDDTRDALCEGESYVLEVALRGRRSGIAYREDEPDPVAPPPAGEPARILAVVSARDTDFEIGEPVQFIELPARIEADSSVHALFRCATKRRTTSADDLADIEVRLYYEMNLIEHVVLSAEIRGRNDCEEGSGLGLAPPIVIRQMKGVARDYTAIVRGLQPRYMSVDVRALDSGVRFSITVGTAKGKSTAARAHQVVLHGRCDLGDKDLGVAVNRIRDLWRDVAVDRFAGVVDGGARIFQRTLRDLATEGRDLWSLLFRGAQGSAMWNIGEWLETHRPGERAMVEVRLLDGAQSFVFPWALLYDGPEPSAGVDLEGFWGLRYAIEQKPVSRTIVPDAATDATAGLDLAFMVWDSFPNAADQTKLLGDLATKSQGRLRVGSPPVNDPHAFYTLVEDCASDILYFYAHGHTRPSQADADYHDLDRFRERYELLAEDSPQRAALKDLYDMVTHPDFDPGESWIALSGGRLYLRELRAKTVNLTRRPIVILNMCESAQVLPGLADSFVTFFLDRQARSVIGTECPMTNQFAHPFSERLLAELLEGESLGEALRLARLHFMQRKNPLGLAYTLFGSGTTKYDPALLEAEPPPPARATPRATDPAQPSTGGDA